MKIVSHACADQRGFTFGEFLVAMAVLGLIMTGLASLMMSGNQTYATGSKQIEAQQGARVALERMVREIRGAGYNPTGASCPPTNKCPIVGNPGFGSPSATNLAIQNDTNADGNFDATERIVYTLNGTNLDRKEGTAAAQTIMGGIQALTFTYLDENDVETGQPQDIRSVRISLTTRPESQAAIYQAGRAAVTMSDTIRLRNR